MTTDSRPDAACNPVFAFQEALHAFIAFAREIAEQAGVYSEEACEGRREQLLNALQASRQAALIAAVQASQDRQAVHTLLQQLIYACVCHQSLLRQNPGATGYSMFTCRIISNLTELQDLCALVAAAKEKRPPLVPGMFSWRDRTLSDLPRDQWLVVTALVDGDQTKPGVDVASLIKRVYPKKKPKNPSEAIRKIRERLNDRLHKLKLRIDGTKVLRLVDLIKEATGRKSDETRTRASGVREE